DGFHHEHADVCIVLHAQSADIAKGVDEASGKEEGAGDQGIMFGHACSETPALMPAPIFYAHKILQSLSEARKSGQEKHPGPDAKSQLTVRYENGRPVGISQIVLSHQHIMESLTSQEIREIVTPYIMKTLPEGWVTPETVWHVNPTGKFHIG